MFLNLLSTFFKNVSNFNLLFIFVVVHFTLFISKENIYYYAVFFNRFLILKLYFCLPTTYYVLVRKMILTKARNRISRYRSVVRINTYNNCTYISMYIDWQKIYPYFFRPYTGGNKYTYVNKYSFEMKSWYTVRTSKINTLRDTYVRT